MPFKSKAQQRFMFAAESRGDVPKGTAKRWAHHTKSITNLPEHAKKQGSLDALATLGLKEASWAPGQVLPMLRSTPLGTGMSGAGAKLTMDAARAAGPLQKLPTMAERAAARMPQAPVVSPELVGRGLFK